jgi:hypothetical protein
MAKNGHNRPAKMGRPTKYTEELVERFCEEIINGCSVHEICSRPDWPSEATIYNWLLKHEDFLEKYRIARELQADKLVDDLLPIADGERPTVIDGKPLDPSVQVRRDAERIKVRMWKAGRMSPRKWGDRILVGCPSGTASPRNRQGPPSIALRCAQADPPLRLATIGG